MTDLSPDIVVPSFVTPVVSSSDLIERTKQYLHTGSRENRNRTTSALNDTETGVDVQYDLARIGPGARISVGLEDMYVWSAAGNSAEVERGQFGSVATSHSSGTMVFVDPRYSPSEIFRELQNTLTALPGLGVYRMLTVDLTFDPSVGGYDLTAVGDAFLEVYEIYYDTGVREEWRKVENWTFAPLMPTSSFPSSRVLFMYDGGVSNRTIRVKYRARFEPLLTLEDTADTLGLPSTSLDLLPLGAAVNLTTGTEIRRNDLTTQGDTRRPGEVPAGAALRSNLGLAQQFRDRVREEADNLFSVYPPLQPRIWNW